MTEQIVSIPTEQIAEANALLKHADKLLSPNEIELILHRLADEITPELADKFPLVLCTMTGGLVFAGKLLPLLGFPLELDYLHATRYGKQTSGNQLIWHAHPLNSLEGRVLLILDDIFDEGKTLAELQMFCKDASAAEVYTAVLVNKVHDRKDARAKSPDFCGVELEDRYLFGYGMDCRGLWRNAPGIFALKEDV